MVRQTETEWEQQLRRAAAVRQEAARAAGCQSAQRQDGLRGSTRDNRGGGRGDGPRHRAGGGQRRRSHRAVMAARGHGCRSLSPDVESEAVGG